MVNSSALVRATGFSKAISFAPPPIAALIIGVRRLGSVQKQKDVRLHRLRQRGGIGALLRVAELGRGVVQAFRVDVTDAGDLEFGVGIESGGVVHAAFAHADDEDGVLSHNGVMERWSSGEMKRRSDGLVDSWIG
jgi:hypothetical protein